MATARKFRGDVDVYGSLMRQGAVLLGGDKIGTFNAYPTTTYTNSSGGALFQGNATEVNSGGWYSTSTYLYTPQMAGYYMIGVYLLTDAAIATNAYVRAILRKNSSSFQEMATGIMATGTLGPRPSGTWVGYLNGSTDNVGVWIDGSVNYGVRGASNSNWSKACIWGHRIG